MTDKLKPIVVYDLSTDSEWTFAHYVEPKYAMADTEGSGVLTEFLDLPMLAKAHLLQHLPFQSGSLGPHLFLGDFGVKVR